MKLKLIITTLFLGLLTNSIMAQTPNNFHYKFVTYPLKDTKISINGNSNSDISKRINWKLDPRTFPKSQPLKWLFIGITVPYLYLEDRYYFSPIHSIYPVNFNPVQTKYYLTLTLTFKLRK